MGKKGGGGGGPTVVDNGPLQGGRNDKKKGNFIKKVSMG